MLEDLYICGSKPIPPISKLPTLLQLSMPDTHALFPVLFG